MTDLHVWAMTGIIALVTAVIRFLPFVLWSGDAKTPPLIEKLGKVLPNAVMGMLVVYCLKDVHFAALSGFLPAAIACIAVAGSYLWKRNSLLSVLIGTILYMALTQQLP